MSPPSNPARPGVLFDVDGTLVDSNYLHALAWRRAFDELGIFVPTSTLHHAIGMGSDRYVPAVVGREVPGASEGHSRHYSQLHGELRAFPSAPDLLREVSRRGGRVALATSAKQDELEVLLATIGAGDGVIDHVTTSGDVASSKPAPNIFAVAMEGAGLDRDQTVVVGDTVWDVEAASRCGLACVCVLTGGIGREQLQAAAAVAVYHDVASILDGLDESPLGRLLG